MSVAVYGRSAEPCDSPVVPCDSPVVPCDSPVEPCDSPVEPCDSPVVPCDSPVVPCDSPVVTCESPVADRGLLHVGYVDRILVRNDNVCARSGEHGGCFGLQKVFGEAGFERAGKEIALAEHAAEFAEFA